MNQKIGTCSICGSDVVGFSGAWYGVTPPPPARCTKCGAVETRRPVIEMVRPSREKNVRRVEDPRSDLGR